MCKEINDGICFGTFNDAIRVVLEFDVSYDTIPAVSVSPDDIHILIGNRVRQKYLIRTNCLQFMNKGYRSQMMRSLRPVRYSDKEKIIMAFQRTCPNCGAVVKEDAVFCPQCGASIGKIPATPEQPPVPVNVCPHCGAPLRPDAKFCPECGSVIEAVQVDSTPVCPHCGTQVKKDAQFCPSCGASLGAAATSPIPPQEQNRNFCPKCGVEVPDDVRFCPSCGADLQKSPTHDSIPGNANVSSQAADTFNQGAAYGSVGTAAGAAGGATFAAAHRANGTVDSIKEKYLSFEGRLNRKPYFLRGLLMGVVTSILMGIFAALADKLAIFYILVVAVYVLAFVCGVSLGVRRLHDLNRTGWMFLLFLIPLVNIALAIYMLFFRGTEGHNKYGPDPLGY